MVYPHHLSAVVILSIGAVVGFLSGMLGKGGSAITTPALQIFCGVNPFAALASPLPATLPTTLSASLVYAKKNLVNRKVILWSILLGIPATFLGSFWSDALGGKALMALTAIFVMALGITFLISRPKPDHDVTAGKSNPEREHTSVSNAVESDRQQLSAEDKAEGSHPKKQSPQTIKIAAIALSVGFLSGLLANSGGVLFGPLFIRALRMPVKQALASSLLVAAGLAVPGTLAHWYLGHIDWWIVLLLSLSAVPSSYLGARAALRLKSAALERIFGIMLLLFGAFDIWYTITA